MELVRTQKVTQAKIVVFSCVNKRSIFYRKIGYRGEGLIIYCVGKTVWENERNERAKEREREREREKEMRERELVCQSLLRLWHPNSKEPHPPTRHRTVWYPSHSSAIERKQISTIYGSIKNIVRTQIKYDLPLGFTTQDFNTFIRKKICFSISFLCNIWSERECILRETCV